MNQNQDQKPIAVQISEKLGRLKRFPAEPEPRTEAWYRKRRELLQRQKVELLEKFGKKAA